MIIHSLRIATKQTNIKICLCLIGREIEILCGILDSEQSADDKIAPHIHNTCEYEVF